MKRNELRNSANVQSNSRDYGDTLNQAGLQDTITHVQGFATGNVWLFGGSGYDSAGTFGRLNDLWKVEGNNWAWIW